MVGNRCTARTTAKVFIGDLPSVDRDRAKHHGHGLIGAKHHVGHVAI